MKYLKTFESVDKTDRFEIKIKPNVENKSKWYYGYLNSPDWTGKVITVKNSESPHFDNHYAYPPSQSGGSYFLDKEDCEII
jgi:hypothetical protein